MPSPSRKPQAPTGAFDTWRSLCVDQNLSNLAAVDLMAALVSSAGAEASTAQLAE